LGVGGGGEVRHRQRHVRAGLTL